MLYRLLIFTFLALSSLSATAEDEFFRVGQLVKCSYKGESNSTKTVECQLRQGLNSRKIWRFSAYNKDWDHLAAAAGKQVLINYRAGDIANMESDFSLIDLTVIDKTRSTTTINPMIEKSTTETADSTNKKEKNSPPVDKVITQSSDSQAICKIGMPEASYSIGFRVIRVLSAETIDDRWRVQGQLGGDGDLALWSFEITKEDNQPCYQKLLDIISSGKKRVFYYQQKEKNGIYKIWKII